MRFLPHILTPVYRITEEDTIRDAGMGTLDCPQFVTRVLMCVTGCQRNSESSQLTCKTSFKPKWARRHLGMRITGFDREL